MAVSVYVSKTPDTAYNVQHMTEEIQPLLPDNEPRFSAKVTVETTRYRSYASSGLQIFAILCVMAVVLSFVSHMSKISLRKQLSLNFTDYELNEPDNDFLE